MGILIVVSLALIPIFIGEAYRWLIRLFPPHFADQAPIFKIGDRIIYNKTKFSGQPAASARWMHPSEHGECYSYVVEKYWVVADILHDGHVVAKTRRGKTHLLLPMDANLRKAPLLKRVLERDRFPNLALAA